LVPLEAGGWSFCSEAIKWAEDIIIFYRRTLVRMGVPHLGGVYGRKKIEEED
jgi:hypothetical protein